MSSWTISDILGTRRFYPLALLLSGVAHLAIGLAIGKADVARQDARTPDIASTISVELRPGATEKMLSEQATEASAVAGPLSRSTSDANARQQPEESISESAPLIPIAGAPEPYYFRTSQLTQKPLISENMPGDMILTLPELNGPVATLRLLISAQGDIDQVIVENTVLPEHAVSRITEVFAKARFQPGKIGRLAVRSQLKIEIRAEDVFPAPHNGQPDARNAS